MILTPKFHQAIQVLSKLSAISKTKARTIPATLLSLELLNR